MCSHRRGQGMNKGFGASSVADQLSLNFCLFKLWKYFSGKKPLFLQTGFMGDALLPDGDRYLFLRQSKTSDRNWLQQSHKIMIP